jgi:DNA-binding SARP family transcriptional activator
VEFRVLGPVRVLADGNDVPINGLRRKALLAMLVVHCAEVVPVGRMVEELWNGSPPPGAMGTLKSHVHQLRRVLAVENLVAARAGGYVLQADRSQVDAFEFERQVAAARAARDRGDLAAAGPAFEAALALFRGQPLTDVADLDFAVREARRLNQLALDASEDRFEVALALGRHTAVLTELETLAGAHPLRERLIGQLMVSLYRCGRQADALAVYRTTRAQLLEQLGIDPGHELQALERAILDQADELDPPRRPATVPPAPPSATAPDRAPIDRRDAVPFPLTTSGLLPFVGRETELAELADQWRAVTGGERRAVIISGEPGIGKTRQAAELAGFVAEDGGTVLYGACDEELGVPYQPFAEALRRHLRRVGFRLPTVHHGLDGELTRLLPELPRLIPDLPPPTDTDPESQRYLLFDAVAATLAGIAAETPTLLVIEDIHWATRSTLLLLRHLLSSSEPTALLVVATRRDVEAPTTESRDLLAALTRLPLVLRLELGLLGGDEARSLVESVHEAPLDPRRLDRLLADAQGNPFFLTELIRHVGQAAGTAASEGVAPSSASSPTDLPAGIRDLIDRRTAHLSGPPEVLTAAAVLGSTFDLGTLARTVDRSAPPDAVTSVVDEGVRLGLLRPDGPGRFAFAHDLVRRHLSTRVGPAGRVAVHLRVGLAVEQLSRPGERLEALAHHFTEAATGGGGVKALSYSMAAAERALTQTDFEQGAGLIRRAIDATRADPSIPASLMAEGYECLALTVLPTSTGSFAAHRSACREAAEWARSAGSAEALAVAAIEALRWSQADTFEPEIEALAAEALARRDELPEPLAALLVARSAFYRSTLEGYGPPLEGASREALSVARASGAPEAMREAIVARYWSIFSTPKADERLALGEELLHLPDGPVLRSRAARMHRGYEAPTDRCFRALARLELGDRDGFEEDLLVLDASGERSGVAASRSTLWHGLLLLLDGRFGEADRLVNAMRAKALDANYAASYAGQLAELRYQQGRLPELASLMASAVRPGPRPGGRQAIAALAHAQAGQPTTARTLLATLAVDDFARVPRDLSWTATLSWASEAAAVLAEPDTAASLYRLLRPHHGRAVVAAWGVVCRGAFDRYLGMLASTSGEIGAAREHYEAALRLEERLRSAPSLARTRYWFGRSLLDAGDDRDRRRADGLLRMARATAESLGMGRLVSDIDRLVIRHIRN